jgi:hypothetical protein
MSKPHSNFKFIDDERFGSHSILMYESEQRGLAAQFRYLHNGLAKGEHIIYLTYENPEDVEDKICDNVGIDSPQKEARVHVIQVPDKISTSEDALEQFQEIVKMIKFCDGAPFRLAGRIMKDINTKKEKQIQLTIEEKFHTITCRQNGSVLCSYPITKVKNRYERKWMFDLFRNHFDVIYAPKHGEGASFDANFMI